MTSRDSKLRKSSGEVHCRDPSRSLSPCSRDHASPHRARSHCAGRPEAKKPQQTLRKAPSKSPFFFCLLFQFLLLDGGKTKRGSDYSGTRREPTAGWLVRVSLESPGRRLTQLEWEEGNGGGRFCRSVSEQQEGEQAEKEKQEAKEKLFRSSLAYAVALKQASGW